MFRSPVKAAALAALLFTAACSHQMQSRVRVEDYGPFVGVGDGSIVGQGFMRQVGGGVVTCAGAQVIAVPSTQYTRERFAAALSGLQVNDPDAHTFATLGVTKLSRCDAQGNFTIENLRPGTWLVATDVTWMVGYSAQGGSVVGEAQVSEGKATQIILTR